MKIRCEPARKRGHPKVVLAVVFGGLFPGAAHAQLSFLNSWGSEGSRNGQFNGFGIGGLAVGPDGTVYVTDSGNYRVQYFSPTGTFLGSFGSQGGGPGQFENIEGVAVANTGSVYVVDNGLNHVDIFDSTGAFQSSFNGDYEYGHFGSPFGVAVGTGGVVYVADAVADQIEFFGPTGVYQGFFTADDAGLSYPESLAVAPNGTVYVADNPSDGVQYFSALDWFEGFFSLPSPWSPGGVAVGPTGIVYVADTGNQRIDVFSSTGEFQYSVGSRGTGDGQFESPYAVTVAPTGMVYVADTQNNRVVRLFDPSSWVSGTNDFTDPTVGPTSVAVGPGQLLGTSLTLDASMGLVVGDTTKIGAGGSLVLAGGTLSTNTLAVCPGGFLQIGNGGSIGSLSGAIVNNGAVTIVSSEAPEVVSSAISNTGSLLVEGNGLVTLMGAVVNNGSLNINAKSVCANISGSGTLTVGTIGSPTTLQLAAGSGPDDQSMLTVNIGSTLDITNNAIAINYGCPANDPVKAILRYLLSGYIGGSWTGTEIISSTAAAGYAAGTGPALSIGYADGNTDADTVAGPNQVLVKFTLAGDALLNGTVDFNDLDVVGRHLNTTGNDWADGNFTYDPKGAVNFNDLDIIGQNLNMTLNGSGDLLGGTTIPLGAAANIQNTIVIPEPSVLAVGAAGAAAMLLCRRRRCYS